MNNESFSVALPEAYYINLEHRYDRRTAIERVLGAADLHFERFDAVRIRQEPRLVDGCGEADIRWCYGKTGCKLSHVRVLQRATSISQYKHVMIFEDDFEWTKNVDPRNLKHVIHTVQRAFPGWKVILLSANLNLKRSNNTGLQVYTSSLNVSNVLRVSDAQTTHAYVVNRDYIPKLKENFEQCNVLLKNNAIDHCWKTLQSVDEWYGFLPQLGIQRAGYSDIQMTEAKHPWALKGL